MLQKCALISTDVGERHLILKKKRKKNLVWMAQAFYVRVLSHVFSGERLQRKEEEEEEAEAGSVSF